MKGFGANRSRHMSDSCEPARCPQKPLCPLTSDPHGAFLLTPTINHYGTLDPHLHLCSPTSPTSLNPDCLLPFSQMSNSSTFPRLHYSSQAEQVDCSQACMAAAAGGVGQGGRAGAALSNSLSMGMGLGLGLTGAPMITSGSATISSSSAAAAKMNRLPSNLLDQLERHLPLQRDGFSTLQFHRGRMSKQRSESPGRIRHLMHSVQKLFAKSQSLENSAIKGNVNGRSAGGTAGGAAGAGEDGGRPTRRSKSKDRAKTEGTKQRQRPNALGLWSSDDTLDTDTTTAGTIAVGYRNPLSMMSLGRAVSDSQAGPRHIPQGYHTISAHTLKTSKSSSDLKFLACQATQVVSKEEEGRIRGSKDDLLVKRGSWSTLTLSQARQVLQKGSATVNRTLLKSKSCHQDMAQQFLQVPLGDWAGTLGHGRPRGTEIPCRRMRSGSYVKAMGDLEDSEDSEGSPKPSPKATARRQSYLRATQHSLSEQQPPPPQRKPRCYALMQEDYLWSPLQSACSMQHLSSLPCLKELSTNRSLDNLDCLVSPLEPPPRYRNSDFSRCSGTLGRGSATQRVSLHTFFQVYGQGCGHSLPYCQGESQAVEALDLPAPTCFRSRSHSYLRAIQAGCSQDEDTASVDSESPPHTGAGYSYSSNTLSNRKAPPPVPPRTTSKPLISVTVQSSTESAQDVYIDQQERGSEANSQSGRSNSSDSLCSIRTAGLAKGSRPLPVPVPAAAPGPAAGSVHPVPAPRDLPHTAATATVATTTTSTSTQSQNDTPSIGFTLDPVPVATKRKLSSIGIQVDCLLPVLREEPLPLTAPLKFQSIGVQVENGRPLSRETSMASRQNTETEPQDATENNTANCTNSQTADANAPNGQDKAMEQQPLKHTHAPSRISSPPQVTLDPALDPSSLPPPDPSLESGNCCSHGDAGQPGPPACLRDGNWFMKLLQAETGRMEGWCQQMEQETKDNKLSEEVLGTIRSAVGSAQLLMTKKFEQFRGLCKENLNLNANPRPTAQDLAGFWDLLQLSIEDISMKFDELFQLKANNWQLPEKSEKDENKQLPSSVPKKQTKPKLSAGKDRSVDSAVDKQRQEARKRLIAAKRAASVRQNSATESADSVEIYVPEAQTRL
uniref:Discs, large (Drosophila) homolog-associated protein 4a n=1 Tax=Gasterosteus aculeatus aculeatus TaxID=481459 RepID=A0AAQ4QSG3_GASAC|nr:disks large-associated protein 4 isoform X1 [Gasterosteus aculeatus aculeatus]XP_040050166.1 disks large-associated protein 4 isoform X1 [Gasterosteus aculeatus aculeatus]XP_040050167.1 disks large-associated protein 4 isoform X1 [Gasterosteus aculeatus aculeatus]